MQNFIFMVLEKYSYFGVFFLIFIENIFPPIPSEVILLLSGFMTSYTSLNVMLMIIFSSFGSLFGAILLYYIGKMYYKLHRTNKSGKILNKDRLKKIVRGKIGKVLFLKEKDIDKADAWFDNKGNKSVFFCRFVPIVRSLISIPAGMSEMPMVKFIVYTFCGSLIWNTVLIRLGHTLSDNWSIMLDILDKYKIIAIVIMLCIFIYVLYRFYKNKPNN